MHAEFQRIRFGLSVMLIRNTFGAKHRASGFSLVELMVSVTIGLIVAAGAVSLIVAIDRSNSETIQATRLTQELRSLAGVVADDLKRTLRVYDPIGDVGQGVSVNCPTTGTPKTPLQPCFGVYTHDASGANADTQCVMYGYTGTISGTTVYNYRSIRRVVTNGIGTLVVDQNATIDGGVSGTNLLTSGATGQQATCPIPDSSKGASGTTTTYQLSSNEVDITSVCFSSATDAKTCYFNSATNACELNNTAVASPSGNEVDICIAGKLRAGDIYEKNITRAFLQPVFIRSIAVK